MNYIKMFLALMFATAAGIASAQVTGNELYGQLKSANTSENLRGYAYINGIVDAEAFYLDREIISSVTQGLKEHMHVRFHFSHFCFGNDNVTLGQITDIVIKYLETNPEKRHYPAYSLIRFALIEDFPCANNPK